MLNSKKENDKKDWPEMQRIIEEFGQVFSEASLSKIDFPKETMQKIFKWVNKPEGILFFASNPGVGKTYTCAAFAAEWQEKKWPWRKFDERSLLAHLRKKIKEDVDYGYELRSLCDSVFFILDDMGSAKESDWQKEIIFDFVDIRWASRKPTIITSNYSLDHLEEIYGPRFGSRMRDRINTIIEINHVDRRIDLNDRVVDDLYKNVE